MVWAELSESGRGDWSLIRQVLIDSAPVSASKPNFFYFPLETMSLLNK